MESSAIWAIAALAWCVLIWTYVLRRRRRRRHRAKTTAL
jgi:hypothetical protein